MKDIVFDNPNKMHMDSGFKLFDKQTNYIGTGNVIANTQYSSFIRPYGETRCNGYEFKEGHLMKSDLKLFNNLHLSEDMYNAIHDTNRHESVILYEFSVHHKDGCTHRKEVIGYVLTDYNHNLISKSVVCGAKRNFMKRCMAIEEAAQYVCA